MSNIREGYSDIREGCSEGYSDIREGCSEGYSDIRGREGGKEERKKMKSKGCFITKLQSSCTSLSLNIKLLVNNATYYIIHKYI